MYVVIQTQSCHEQGLKFGHGHALLPADVDALQEQDPFGHGLMIAQGRRVIWLKR